MHGRDAETSLTVALGATAADLIAFVGAGGKTTALQTLAAELAASGAHVLATTTTAMLAAQLSSTGPLLLEDEDLTPLEDRAAAALRGAAVVGLARAHAGGGKVKGLSPATADALWAARPAEAMVVEADGSRGLPLKAFGQAEPQLPALTTVAVVLAGLDALGQPLDVEHVHRAGLLAPLLGVAPGTPVTPALMGAALALQVARVRGSVPAARVVVLLNKADDDERAAEGGATGAALLAAFGGRGSARPDRIVVGSIAVGHYDTVYG